RFRLAGSRHAPRRRPQPVRPVPPPALGAPRRPRRRPHRQRLRRHGPAPRRRRGRGGRHGLSHHAPPARVGVGGRLRPAWRALGQGRDRKRVGHPQGPPPVRTGPPPRGPGSPRRNAACHRLVRQRCTRCSGHRPGSRTAVGGARPGLGRPGRRRSPRRPRRRHPGLRAPRGRGRRPVRAAGPRVGGRRCCGVHLSGHRQPAHARRRPHTRPRVGGATGRSRRRRIAVGRAGGRWGAGQQLHPGPRRRHRPRRAARPAQVPRSPDRRLRSPGSGIRTRRRLRRPVRRLPHVAVARPVLAGHRDPRRRRLRLAAPRRHDARGRDRSRRGDRGRHSGGPPTGSCTHRRARRPDRHRRCGGPAGYPPRPHDRRRRTSRRPPHRRRAL
ncbi:uncharacterized protein METZ01_LOCUS267295, partial [marine metagenome]